MGKLEGKLALVTGASRGIGLATAVRFVEEGAQVFMTARRGEELVAAAAPLGAQAVPVACDVTKPTDLKHLFKRIRRDWGRLDILFANAGIAALAPLGDIAESFYDEMFEVNVKATLFTVQGALPLMADGGSIILEGSVVGSKGLPANSVYSATKAAVRSFARTWTTDLKARRIRVNAVSPSSIDTPGFNALLASGEAGEQRRAMIANAVPLGRLGTPQEVANAVVFLASDESSYVTGAELFVDGGFAQV